MKTITTENYDSSYGERVTRMYQTRTRETELLAIKERKVIIIGKDWIKAPNWTAMEFVLK